MSQTYTFYPQGVCSHQFDLEMEGDSIVGITPHGGCPGNLEGIARLITGLDVRDVIEKLEGVRCGHRPTSCPDQIARACKALLECRGVPAANLKDLRD